LSVNAPAFLVSLRWVLFFCSWGCVGCAVCESCCSGSLGWMFVAGVASFSCGLLMHSVLCLRDILCLCRVSW